MEKQHIKIMQYFNEAVFHDDVKTVIVMADKLEALVEELAQTRRERAQSDKDATKYLNKYRQAASVTHTLSDAPNFTSCKRCDNEAVAVFYFSHGCVCDPATVQPLCHHHSKKSQAVEGGTMELIKDLTVGQAFTREWRGLSDEDERAAFDVWLQSQGLSCFNDVALAAYRRGRADERARQSSLAGEPSEQDIERATVKVLALQGIDPYQASWLRCNCDGRWIEAKDAAKAAILSYLKKD